MLDAAAMHMPAVFLRSLKEQLQLDVRYLTRPEKGEGGPLPPVPVSEVVDQSELIESLRRRIAELEKENGQQKYTIRDLEEKLREALEALRAAGAPVTSPIRKRELPSTKECQTDPWAPFPTKGPEVVQQGAPPAQVVQQVDPGVKPKRPKKPGPAAADTESSDEEVQVESKKPAKRAAKKSEGETVRDNTDYEAIRRLQAELDLLKMKLAAAEKELAKMEGLKEEIERLKKLLAERDARIAELEEELRKLKEMKPKAEKNEGKKETKKPTQVSSEEPKKKEKKYKQDPAPIEKGPTAPSGEGPKQEEKEQIVEIREEPAEVVSEPEEESEEEPPPPKVFEDKCVGNGPGRGLQDEPLVCKGRALQKDEELNKTGRCYELNLVEQPKLGLSNAGNVATIDLDGSLARTAGQGGRGPGVYSGGSGMLGGVQFASSWASKSTGRLLANTWTDPEPYLTQVWEQHPRGHKTPVKRELIKLGAISPHKASTLSLQSMASLGGSGQKSLASDATVKCEVLEAAVSS
mmetsp:Transcript_7324/g.16880  ORF Transcript_7324/g.16880 Transcript_7324/m.16880 type:complete len:521 (+) Transcript_7324:411-1973(+)